MQEQVITSYHEAGHAVVAHLMGWTVEKVSIVPDKRDGTLGRAMVHAKREWAQTAVRANRRKAIRDWTISGALVVLAGASAERVLTGREVWPDDADGGDYDLAIKYIERLCPQRRDETGEEWYDRIITLYERLITRATRLLRNPENWALVETVAHELLKRGEVGPEVESILTRVGAMAA